MTSSTIPVVIGVDIGGTNTDVVLVSHVDGRARVLAEVKELTSADVTSGVQKGVLRALLQARDGGHLVSPIQVNIGTTHFVNAVVQGRGLAPVGVVRICGPVSEELPPFSDFPVGLAGIVKGAVNLVHGGYRYDGKEHEPMDEQQIRDVITSILDQGIHNIVYVGVFSPTRPDQEIRALEITLEVAPDVSVTLSHEVGTIGILERENAAILNESLKPLCRQTVSGFKVALESVGVTCPFYLTQNDGTVISSEGVLDFPVLTFASGPTNSMRGAAFLSDLQDAVVVDVGGTTTDVGVLRRGFPREAATHVRVGGVRTNFRMPDVVSIGLGGGSYVTQTCDQQGDPAGVKVGPLSAGLNLLKEARVFTGDQSGALTATDIAVAAGLHTLGDPTKVSGLDKALVNKAMEEIHNMVEALVDRIKLSREELPVIVVGGGSILIDMSRRMRGVTRLIVPEHFGVANAIGAALSKVAASVNTIVNLLPLVDTTEMERHVISAVAMVTDDPDGKKADLAVIEAKKPFFEMAREQAIGDVMDKVRTQVVAAGAEEGTVEVLDKQDSVLAYMPGNATQIKVKVVGDLAGWNKGHNLHPWQKPQEADDLLLQNYSQNLTSKQAFSSTGQRIGASQEVDIEEDHTKTPRAPHIDADTGEWLLSEWDIECIVVGAGIYGCGGGASPHMGRLRALRYIREGKRMRVVTPERLLRDADPDKDIVMVSAFIGAPLIMYEQAVSSAETTRALECLREVYEVGGYTDGGLTNTEGVAVETNAAGLKFVQNYRPAPQAKRSPYNIVGLMSAEIGGMNAIEPFLIAANLDLPIVDADGMSRAFPEVQMFLPYMYGEPSYPVAIVGSGNAKERSALLYSPGNKLTENFLRDVSIANGCSAGMAMPVKAGDVMTKTALHTVSRAWRLGDAILRARVNKTSVMDAIVEQENARHVLTGKVTDIQRETSGGFNRGHLVVEGVDEWVGKEVRLDFQNENLVIFPIQDGRQGACLGSVPDLVCVVDGDTAEPVTTEEVKYGLRVAVLLMPSHHLLRREEALRWVSPKAFHYEDVEFQPFRVRSVTVPVPPV